MKKLSLFLSVLLIINLFPLYTYAQVNDVSTAEISVILTNEENPSETHIITLPVNPEQNSINTSTVNGDINVTTDVIVSIPDDDSDTPDINISTRTKVNDALSIASSQTNTGSDSSGSYKASITCTYNSNTSGYLLTKVNGSWTKQDPNVSISNREVIYACTSGTQQSQRTVKKPSSSTYSYSTGYSKRVKDVGSTLLGGVASCKLKRGTGSKWNFTVNCNVIKNSVGW